MSEVTTLAQAIAGFLDELRRKNASPETIRAYGSDLREFAAYFTIPNSPPRRLRASIC